MRYRILVLGGYGTFGARISRELAKDSDLTVIIGGRNPSRAEALARTLRADIPRADVESVCCDIEDTSFAPQLRALSVAAVINTCGPFQQRDYQVAETCIRAGIHYIDLADARDYVAHFDSLDTLAKQHNVLAVTGASTVPALAAAVIDRLTTDLSVHTIGYGINPGNQTPRGLATVRAILSYCGKPFRQWRDGRWIDVYGWQGLVRRRYPSPMGRRWLSYCNVPDLSLFPQRYPGVRDIEFRAGLELWPLHLGTWTLSWLARWRLVNDWSRYAPTLLRISEWLTRMGSDIGGMHVSVTGTDEHGRSLRRTWYLIAQNGDGPQVPCTPSVILARKLAKRELPHRGAMACIGLLTLDELTTALSGCAIETYTTEELLAAAHTDGDFHAHNMRARMSKFDVI